MLVSSIDAGGVLMLSAAKHATVMHVIPLGMALLVVTYSRLMVLMIWRKYVPEAPKSLLRPMSLTTDHDPERKEDVLVLLTCFRESKQELAHSISTLRDTQTSARLMVFVDGLQRVNMDTITKMAGAAGGDVEIATHECTDDKKLEMNQGPVPEEMATLASLLSLLPSGRVLQEHGCVCIRGEIEASTPYEIYVKGPGCPQSKRASHALCMSILHADFDAGRPNPKAVLLLDGDCRVEPAHLGEMFRCLQEQDLAACGPWPVPEKVHTSCLLAQAVRDVIMHPLGWMGQSAARFVFPLRGSCAMYSIEAVRAVQSDYCEGVREESVLDSMMIENGEDSYMTNLVHEKCPGNGIRFLPHCHATSFMPESWSEYLAQQCRWKRSFLGNRVMLCFGKPSIWLWPPSRWVFWPLYVCSFFWTPPLAAATLTLWFSASIGAVLERHPQVVARIIGPFIGPMGIPFPDSVSAGLHAALWIVLSLYAFASAGTSVAAKRSLHVTATAFFILLGLVQMGVFIVAFGVWKYPAWWALTMGPSLILMIAQAPHNLSRTWPHLLFFLVPVMMFVENVQQTLVAVANADGSAARWGTRTSEEEEDFKGWQRAISTEASRREMAIQIRIWSRRSLLAVYLAANFSIGQVLLQRKLHFEASWVLAHLTFGFLLLHLILSVGYSAWLLASRSHSQASKL